MKKLISVMLSGLFIVPVFALSVGVFAPLTVSAADCTVLTAANGAECAKGEGQKGELFGDGSIFSILTDTALFIIGAISVLMLIYGGIRYTISGGDSANVTAAKNTILYAIVGVIVAMLSYAIVHFVIGKLITP